MHGNRALRLAVSAASTAVIAASLGGCASAAPGVSAAEAAADADAIAARASVSGIAPDLVYAITVDDFDLAPQSVGPGAESGMSATWFNQRTGAMLTIRTDYGEMTAASCRQTPLWDAPGVPVTCTEENGMWHRERDGAHEYVAVRAGALVTVTGSNTGPSELQAAATSAHVPSNAELERLFSDLPSSSPIPVERGDLPDHGDGGPIDPEGPGG